jgi:hypothetical protein
MIALLRIHILPATNSKPTRLKVIHWDGNHSFIRSVDSINEEEIHRLARDYADSVGATVAVAAPIYWHKGEWFVAVR